MTNQTDEFNVGNPGEMRRMQPDPDREMRSRVPRSRKGPLTPDQIDRWLESKELQPPK